MDEIEKNDYNLNISRYVSTAKAEEVVDLKKVHKDLVSIEKNIKRATEKHNKFLKELGLPLLPWNAVFILEDIFEEIKTGSLEPANLGNDLN